MACRARALTESGAVNSTSTSKGVEAALHLFVDPLVFGPTVLVELGSLLGEADYERVSRSHFLRRYFFPEGTVFANSEALFPPAELASTIRTEYEAQCRLLCHGPPPTWNQVQARFDQLRELL